MALITCKDLSFAYGGDTVRGGGNFAVNAGDYCGVVGENGSGKSRLMKGLLGLKEPETGAIEYGDGLKRSEIGYLPQQTALCHSVKANPFMIRGLAPYVERLELCSPREPENCQYGRASCREQG